MAYDFFDTRDLSRSKKSGSSSTPSLSGSMSPRYSQVMSPISGIFTPVLPSSFSSICQLTAAITTAKLAILPLDVAIQFQGTAGEPSALE
jgi:hypothetical protein